MVGSSLRFCFLCRCYCCCRCFLLGSNNKIFLRPSLHFGVDFGSLFGFRLLRKTPGCCNQRLLAWAASCIGYHCHARSMDLFALMICKTSNESFLPIIFGLTCLRWEARTATHEPVTSSMPQLLQQLLLLQALMLAVCKTLLHPCVPRFVLTLLYIPETI